MRAHLCAVIVVLLAAWEGAGSVLSQTAVPEAATEAAASAAPADVGKATPGAPCAKADFEAVVNAAGAALRDLAQQNTPVFQGKLRQLKDKRGWSNDEFLKQAEPLVRDETITGFDKKSEELVARITGGGAQGEAAAAAPDCGLLASLQGDLKLLVETQTAKWSHMLIKVDQELGK
ncbi:MAG TPA: hypothetical protein VFZ16_16185 [Hyphomicrobiaceae bacterium]|nr:hypothetical protein [Hyphomicrobiaceae bacterium]